jgi:hypothetical protein
VKSIDQDLWHIISIGDIQTKIDKNTKAKLMIYKTLPCIEYEKVFFCKTANDIWKYFLNFHQWKCRAKEEKLDVAQELIVLEKLIDKHLVDVNTSATSSNMVIEGINNEDYMSQLRRKIINETWSDMKCEEDHYITCKDCEAYKAPNEVKSETKHFCYDQFVLEFSKLESNFKSFCNIDSNIIFKNESSTSTEENFEKGKILAKFENSSKSLTYLLNTQRAFL